MRILILGMGCPKCDALASVVHQVIGELGMPEHVDRVGDVNALIAFDVLAPPALVLDGEVKVAGRVPSYEEVRQWFRDKLAGGTSS